MNFQQSDTSSLWNALVWQSVRRWTLIGLSLLLMLLPVELAIAANGDQVTVPGWTGGKNAGFSKQSGLKIQVDSTWSGNRGYRPVRVTASMPTAATADTQITIEFYAGTWRSHNRSITVEHDFELSRGMTSVTTEFSVPQFIDWNGAGWGVWVDGVEDESLSRSSMPFNVGSNGAIALGQLGGSNLNWNSSSGATLIRQVSTAPVEDLLFTQNSLEAPDKWVDYSPLDVCTTNIASLEMLSASSPQKFTALLRWVRAGGNLWVLDIGQDFDRLTQLDRVLGQQTGGQAEADDEQPDLTSGVWRFAQLKDSANSRVEELVNLTMDLPAEERKLSNLEISDSRFPDTAVDSRHWFVARAYGLGTIVALQETDTNQRNTLSAVSQALQRSTLLENLQWAKRHGNDPATGNPHFNNWLIADVGAAPVPEFQLLISLFVVGIGPVNYWLLKRRNQLPAILVTVPLAALATTLLLFAYGFLADGIGTRVRARSVTMLDQIAGESASWARLSYYAGIAPSDGLQMPKDTTVYPIQPPRSKYTPFGRRQPEQQHTLEWTGQQNLTGGWLGSRTPTQYLTITARPTSKKLEFSSAGDGLKVANRLETNVLMLIVQDHEGNFFLGENLEADGATQLRACEHSEAASTLRRILTENLPELPPGYIADSNYRRRGYNYGSSMTESLMELQIEAINAPTAIGWGNGSFIAVTGEGLEVPLGLEDVEETNSFHLIRGSW